MKPTLTVEVTGPEDSGKDQLAGHLAKLLADNPFQPKFVEVPYVIFKIGDQYLSWKPSFMKWQNSLAVAEYHPTQAP